MDIHSKGDYPANALSNFAAQSFVYEGLECASREGFLQSLKFQNVVEQRQICKLIGIEAKLKGEEKGDEWKEKQVLFLKGRAIDRHGGEYQEILDGMFDAIESNPDFVKALTSSGNEVLTHSIGKKYMHETILTENELCSRLMIRRKIYINK